MKILSVVGIIAVLFLSFLTVDLIRSRPDPEWKNIEQGMSLESVEEALGKPSHSLRESKGLQIWNRSGLLRTSSLAVYYGDMKNPHSVTNVRPSRVWLIERL